MGKSFGWLEYQCTAKQFIAAQKNEIARLAKQK
jgi:hypothetical protein